MAYRQAEAAEMLGVGVHTIYRRVRAGTQEHVRIAPATAVVPHWWLAAELGANGGGDLVPALLKASAPVSVHDAADLLGVSVWSVRRGLNMGLIPSGASDGREAVPVEWLLALRTGAAARPDGAGHSEAEPHAARRRPATTDGSGQSDAQKPRTSKGEGQARELKPPLSRHRCAYTIGAASRALRTKPRELAEACRAGDVPAAELRSGLFVVAHHWLALRMGHKGAAFDPCQRLDSACAFGIPEVAKMLGVSRDTIARAIDEERIPFDDQSGDALVPLWWLRRLRTGQEPMEATLRLWRGDAVHEWREINGEMHPVFATALAGELTVPMRCQTKRGAATTVTEGTPSSGANDAGELAGLVVDFASERTRRRRRGA